MNKLPSLILVISILFSIEAIADDALVMEAKALNAYYFDETLPKQPVEIWLAKNLPIEYKAIWSKYITDCGEATGGPVDKERDMPLCAEVEIKKGVILAGYLALFVGTNQKGLLKDNAGLYFGYLEHKETKYKFTKLSEVLNVK